MNLRRCALWRQLRCQVQRRPECREGHRHWKNPGHPSGSGRALESIDKILQFFISSSFSVFIWGFISLCVLLVLLVLAGEAPALDPDIESGRSDWRRTKRRALRPFVRLDAETAGGGGIERDAISRRV